MLAGFPRRLAEIGGELAPEAEGWRVGLEALLRPGSQWRGGSLLPEPGSGRRAAVVELNAAKRAPPELGAQQPLYETDGILVHRIDPVSPLEILKPRGAAFGTAPAGGKMESPASRKARLSLAVWAPIHGGVLKTLHASPRNAHQRLTAI